MASGLFFFAGRMDGSIAHREKSSKIEGLSAYAKRTVPVSRTNDLTSAMRNWLGDGTRATLNRHGDLVITSADGMRKIRFDINNTRPHENVHMHIERFTGSRWVPFDRSLPQIFPRDVPHR